MQQWEYFFLFKDKDRLSMNGKINITPTGFLNVKNPINLIVDELGAHGWEMISYHYVSDANFNMVFKRPKTE